MDPVAGAAEGPRLNPEVLDVLACQGAADFGSGMVAELSVAP
jgi:hypothetical protein